MTKGSDGSQYFEVKDPEGNRVQFVQPPAHPLAGSGESVEFAHDSCGIYRSRYRERGHVLSRRFGFSALLAWWCDGGFPRLDFAASAGWHGLGGVHEGEGRSTGGIPADMSQQTAGVLQHFLLGVPNIEKAVDLMYAGDRLTARHSDPKIGRAGKWQVNLYDPDGIRAELMEFEPSAKPCCSPFLLPSPTK